MNVEAYNLGVKLDPSEFSFKLERLPPSDHVIDCTKYPLETAHRNSFNFIKDELVNERNFLQENYKGTFIGRLLLYLIDHYMVGAFAVLNLKEKTMNFQQ